MKVVGHANYFAGSVPVFLSPPNSSIGRLTTSEFAEILPLRLATKWEI
jgi:hypothetical protein